MLDRRLSIVATLALTTIFCGCKGNVSADMANPDALDAAVHENPQDASPDGSALPDDEAVGRLEGNDGPADARRCLGHTSDGAIAEPSGPADDASDRCWRSAAPLTVVLDIFSGRPNPEWTLEPADQACLAELIDSLPRGSVAAMSSMLGYRGFRIERTTEFCLHTKAGVVYEGDPWSLADGSLPARIDQEKEVEQLLLQTSRPHITDAQYRALESEISSLPDR